MWGAGGGAALNEAIRRGISEEVTCERNLKGVKGQAVQTAGRAPSEQREPPEPRSEGRVRLAGQRGWNELGE